MAFSGTDVAFEHVVEIVDAQIAAVVRRGGDRGADGVERGCARAEDGRVDTGEVSDAVSNGDDNTLVVTQLQIVVVEIQGVGVNIAQNAHGTGAAKGVDTQIGQPGGRRANIAAQISGAGVAKAQRAAPGSTGRDVHSMKDIVSARAGAS